MYEYNSNKTFEEVFGKDFFKKQRKEKRKRWKSLDDRYTTVRKWISNNYWTKHSNIVHHYNLVQEFWVKYLDLPTPDYDDDLIGEYHINTRKLQQIIYIYENSFEEFKEFVKEKEEQRKEKVEQMYWG